MSNPASSEHVGEYAIRDVQGPSTEHRPHFVRSARGIGRLTTTDDRGLDRSRIDWDLIDRAIQEEFSRLTERVLRLIPDLAWKSGSHNARHLALSSYRIFDHRDGDDFDPVYAGITFVEGEGVVRVSGDISGEETGHIFFDRGCELLVSAEHGSVLAAAVEVAGRISAQDQVVCQAIRTRRPSLT